MIYGDFEVLNRKKNRFVYKRSTPEKAYIIDCNLGKDKVTVYDKTTKKAATYTKKYVVKK